MARNKTKSVITAANFEAVKELSGDTAEGQRLLSLIRQSNELTAVHNDGYQGGVSRITDQFSPLAVKLAMTVVLQPWKASCDPLHLSVRPLQTHLSQLHR